MKEPYSKSIEQALKEAYGPEPFVPGDNIHGTSLRTFLEQPVLTGPLVCQFCDDMEFINEVIFSLHKATCHAGKAEYGKRVLHLLAEGGCRRITGQEKQIMVQNFALSTIQLSWCQRELFCGR